MFHESELDDFGVLLPRDRKGQVPEPGDDWREMDWDLGEIDLCEANSIEILEEVWWPKLVDLAAELRKGIEGVLEM